VCEGETIAGDHVSFVGTDFHDRKPWFIESVALSFGKCTEDSMDFMDVRIGARIATQRGDDRVTRVISGAHVGMHSSCAIVAAGAGCTFAL
jgi:hypothetical protein